MLKLNLFVLIAHLMIYASGQGLTPGCNKLVQQDLFEQCYRMDDDAIAQIKQQIDPKTNNEFIAGILCCFLAQGQQCVQYVSINNCNDNDIALISATMKQGIEKLLEVELTCAAHQDVNKCNDLDDHNDNGDTSMLPPVSNTCRFKVLLTSSKKLYNCAKDGVKRIEDIVKNTVNGDESLSKLNKDACCLINVMLDCLDNIIKAKCSEADVKIVHDFYKKKAEKSIAAKIQQLDCKEYQANSGKCPSRINSVSDKCRASVGLLNTTLPNCATTVINNIISHINVTKNQDQLFKNVCCGLNDLDSCLDENIKDCSDGELKIVNDYFNQKIKSQLNEVNVDCKDYQDKPKKCHSNATQIKISLLSFILVLINSFL